MKKQYVYISQADLDEFAPASRRSYAGRHDVFGIPLAFAEKFWGQDSVRGEMARVQKGFNVEGTGTIAPEIESAIFRAIEEQKEKVICFSSLGEALTGMTGDEKYFICGSFHMEMNRRESSATFIQLESDFAPCIINDKKMPVRIVMGMSVSKMLMSVGELRYMINGDTYFDIWGWIFKNSKDHESPRFQFKPFVVGFNWILK